MNDQDCIRNCPVCNKILTYSNKWERNRANKNNKVCLVCRTQKLLQDPEYQRKLNEGVQRFQLEYKNNSFRRKLSLTTKRKLRKNSKRLYGKNNPTYNKSIAQWWVEKYGVEIAEQKMTELSEKRSDNVSGKNNPMYGKPSPKGSGNGWSGWYKGWFFRSLHELSYMINVIERQNLIWESAEQKKYAVPYTDWEGKQRTYFADFIVDGKIMIECKPKKLHQSMAVQSKRTGAMVFCQKNDLTYRMECPILLTIDEIKQLHDNGEIKFLPRYEEKYKLSYV